MIEKVVISKDNTEAQLLASLVRDLNRTGHNPATSGNYSLRSQSFPGYALVSQSGVDKSLFTEDHLLLVDQKSGLLHESIRSFGKKSSDETAVHLAIYRATQANCVLHSHFLESLLFADLYPQQEIVTIQGLELLKGLKGIRSHETPVAIPVFENTQDIPPLAQQIEKALAQVQTYGVLLRGHGLYVWGQSVSEAKRHLEVFEYIFKYYVISGRKN